VTTILACGARAEIPASTCSIRATSVGAWPGVDDLAWAMYSSSDAAQSSSGPSSRICLSKAVFGPPVVRLASASTVASWASSPPNPTMTSWVSGRTWSRCGALTRTLSGPAWAWKKSTVSAPDAATRFASTFSRGLSVCTRASACNAGAAEDRYRGSAGSM
jgi:hypothetical protein